MKFIKLYEDFKPFKFVVLYHYTSIENAIKILNSGQLVPRKAGIENKYTGNLDIANDYGYISFTGNDEYHEELQSEIPIHCRLIFKKVSLKKRFGLSKYDANKEAVRIYADMMGVRVRDLDDLDYQNIDYYGEEDEYRIYGQDVPISEILKIETRNDEEDEELERLCNELHIPFQREAYDA